MERRAAKNGALTKALWDYASYPYGGDRWRKLDAELTGLYGKALQDLKTVEEFWNSGLKRAVAALTDRQFSQDMEEITRMRMEGQFSSSMWRRSYRSSDFGYHAARAVADLAGCLYLETYDQNVKELLTCAHDWVRGFDVRLALELRRGNEEICALVWDAMTGENTEVLLSTPIIRAVVISGREELVDQLLKLLLAARSAGGAEAADSGKCGRGKRADPDPDSEALYRRGSLPLQQRRQGLRYLDRSGLRGRGRQGGKKVRRSGV